MEAGAEYWLAGEQGLWLKAEIQKNFTVQENLKPRPALDELKAGAVIPVYKPRTWTSFDVVRKVRNRLGGVKVGHTGTLDPLAEGLLILCIGAKTKEIDRWMGHEKEYEAVLGLGEISDSCDLETALRPSGDHKSVSDLRISEGLKTMTGQIMQVPPAHSAIKIGGVRAYTKARKGLSPELKARSVQIMEIERLYREGPDLALRIRCSKGTYIRSLARDLGEVWGCGAYLKTLKRTAIGTIHASHAFHVEDFDAFLQVDSPRPHADFP
ncbi:MAG: tRNA pseudouridine(55) synthase TruB [Sphingomonadales bacterium]|nr:tRNA pseudouridine(55) synthase TruB [Sphingomonadales bacterium]